MDKIDGPPAWWWDKEYAVEYFKKIDTFEKFKEAREHTMGPYQDPIFVFRHLLENVLKKQGTKDEYDSAIDALRPFLVSWAKELKDDWQVIVDGNKFWVLLDFFWLCRQWGFPDRQILESLKEPVSYSFPKYSPILDDIITKCR